MSNEYSSDRKTSILDDVSSSKQIKKEIKISNEPMFVVLSTNGWIKSNKGTLEKIDNLVFKSGDSFLDYLNIDNNKEVAFFDQKGFLYTMVVNDMPSGRGYGESLKKYFTIDDGIHVIGMIDSTNKNHTLLCTESGYGFLCDNNDLISSNRKGKAVLRNKLSMLVKPISFNKNNYEYYIIITDKQYMLVGEISDIPIMSKGKGVKLINIPKAEPKEKIIFSGVIRNGERLEITAKNKRSKYIEFDDLEPYIMGRTRRGKKIDNKFTHKNVELIYSVGKNEENILFYNCKHRDTFRVKYLLITHRLHRDPSI